jgi:hypothetical protein
MRFYLAPDGTGKFPQPKVSKDGSTTTSGTAGTADMDEVEIVDVPPARLAVRKFTGFVTDGEVARQKDTLLQALEMDGVELDVPHGAIVPHVVFQYNPPYTLPMVRRNEIAVPVRKVIGDETVLVTSLKEEWNVDVEDDSDDDNSPYGGGVNGLDDVAPSD